MSDTTSLQALQAAGQQFLQNEQSPTHQSLANAMVGLVGAGHVTPAQVVEFMSSAPETNHPMQIAQYVQARLGHIATQLRQAAAQTWTPPVNVGQTPMVGNQQGAPLATTTREAAVNADDQFRRTPQANWQQNQLLLRSNPSINNPDFVGAIYQPDLGLA